MGASDWHLLQVVKEARRSQPGAEGISIGSIAAARRSTAGTASPKASQWIDCNDGDGGVISYIRRGADAERFRRRGVQFHARGTAGIIASACRSRDAITRRSIRTSSFYGGSNVGNGGGLSTTGPRRARPAGFAGR